MIIIKYLKVLVLKMNCLLFKKKRIQSRYDICNWKLITKEKKILLLNG